MKKRTRILLMIVVLLGCGYFGYKTFQIVVRYNFQNKSDVIERLEIKNSKTITYSQKLEENQEYLEFKNIKVRNDFKDFKYLENISTDDLKYALYDENNNCKAAVMIGVVSTYIEYLKSDIDVFTNDGSNISEEDLDNIEKFLKENSINNDIQLFKYIIEHKDDKSNIFTSTKDMKDNYILYYLMHIMLPSNSGLTIIDGTYTGYIFNLKNGIREVSILYYDKRYVFTFIGEDYFTDEYIYDFLNTLVIESSTDELGHVVSPADNNTFTKTYNILNIAESNDYDYLYLTIRQFQGEEVETIKIKRNLVENIEEDKNYEFTFKYIDKNIQDNLDSIFENTELISVIETNKIGLEQIQEPIP